MAYRVRRYTAEEEIKIKENLKQGRTPEEIARLLKRPVSSVRFKIYTMRKAETKLSLEVVEVVKKIIEVNNGANRN